MPRQPEGRLVKAALALIRGRGGRPFKIQGGMDSYQEVGIPDILCCYRGMFLGLEAKQPGEKLSPKQQLVLDEIVAAGGLAQAFTTVEEVADLLTYVEEWSSIEDLASYTDRSRRSNSRSFGGPD